MKRVNLGAVLAVGAAALIPLAACSSDDNGPVVVTTTTTPGAAHTDMRSSLATTASSVVGSALNAAEQAVQNAINSLLAAAPITFDPGSSDLSPGDVATIKAVALPLRGNDTAVTIETYAADPNSATADALAKARGDTVATTLENEGIDKARITVRATGNPSESNVQVDQATIAVKTK
ncbi:OmpA family protein [Nocardia veterana]|uniref:OmpA family protein n=1 Tax=Nocardia veterana TaxID=132249 RepID=A0A7X6LVI0_9NOCA|nr:OmpA family protein [Nocardia veterana]NKY85277.1 OmpA family protein [Nocardia veterana]